MVFTIVPNGSESNPMVKWVLHVKDKPLCVSTKWHGSEAACRSDIATAKTAMKGARFAKVEVVDGG